MTATGKGTLMSDREQSAIEDTNSGNRASAPHLANGPIVLAIVSVLACVAAAMIIPQFHPLHVLPKDLGEYGTGASDELVQTSIDEQRKLDVKNDLAVLALIGGSMAAAIGLIEGLRQKSLVRSAAGLIVGAALGAGGGALGAELAYRIQTELNVVRADAPIQNTIAMHCGVWGPIGLACGISLGVAAMNVGLIVKCGIGGAIGGALASTAYPILAAYVMPGARVDLVYSHNLPSAQWLWLLSAAVLTAVIAGAIGGEQKPPKTAV